MNLDIDYFKTKLKEITEWYENTRWNKKALLEKEKIDSYYEIK